MIAVISLRGTCNGIFRKTANEDTIRSTKLLADLGNEQQSAAAVANDSIV